VKRALARILCLTGSTALGLLFADWAVARWLPLPAMVFRLDEELLFAPVPNARRVLPLAPGAGGAWITTELESHGFRGPELAEPKQGPRVLVLGDSLVMAQTSPIEDTYCVKLGAQLGREVEVVNAGVSGYGPDQECLLLERLLGPLAPDLVVLVLCAHNDFGDLVRDKLFRLGTSEQLVRNRPAFDRELLERFVAAERIVRRPALLLALESLSRRERGEMPGEAEDSPYVEWYLKGAEEEYDEFVLQRNDVVRSLFQDYYDADVSIRPDAPSVQFKQRLMEVVLARVRDDCAKASVPLFVLVVPSSVDLCPTFRMHVDPAQHPGWTPRRMTDAYAQILSRLSIPFVDLAPAFLEAGPEALYLGRADFHWNGKGAELGARRSAGFLREHALWPPRR
jgi:lysophospholipase L1-like esterase